LNIICVVADPMLLVNPELK